jgi:hypothetical protein
MKNVYDGVATLDKRGEATVELWDWSEEVNTDLRYQRTPIGAPAHGLHVSREVAGNQFRTAGGTRGLEVSWQVTGVRRGRVCRSCGMSLTVEVSAIHPFRACADVRLRPRPASTRFG